MSEVNFNNALTSQQLVNRLSQPDGSYVFFLNGNNADDGYVAHWIENGVIVKLSHYSNNQVKISESNYMGEYQYHTFYTDTGTRTQVSHTVNMPNGSTKTVSFISDDGEWQEPIVIQSDPNIML